MPSRHFRGGFLPLYLLLQVSALLRLIPLLARWAAACESGARQDYGTP
ncbi:MAG: hypothetical protein HY717_19375 [Planctomycetes bacterium]|nr:hypothetical protein [Planctomycetota bacterium]